MTANDCLPPPKKKNGGGGGRGPTISVPYHNYCSPAVSLVTSILRQAQGARFINLISITFYVESILL